MENYNIPKRIFYCWFGGEKPPEVIKCIDNWKKMLSGYEIIEINERQNEYFDIEKECRDNLWLKTCRENKIWAYMADYARLKALYDNGGIYFDTDITVEKSFDDLLKQNKLILGWQDDAKIAAGVIISGRNNASLKKILDFYKNDIWNSPEAVITDVLTKTLGGIKELEPYDKITQGADFAVLPPEYFYPMPVGFKDKEPFITGNTHTVHWWGGSWLNTAVLYFIKNKHLADIEDLTEKCFKEKVIYKNALITVKKRFSKYSADIDLKNFQINISRILRKRKARNGE